MPVSPPAAGQVDSELRRSQTQCCDLAPGGCPASCPDAHRPTHGHRHVRNWAIAHISDARSYYKNFFRIGSGEPNRADASVNAASIAHESSAAGEGFDTPRVANESGHHGDTAEKE